MKRPSLGQIMAAMLLLERIHSTLSEVVPSYAEITQNLSRKFRKKLGLSKTLYDKIIEYLETDDYIEDAFMTDHTIQEVTLWEFLQKNLKIVRVLNTLDADRDILLADLGEFEFIETNHITECEVDAISVRRPQISPQCVEEQKEIIGINPYLITMATYKDKPIVIQVRVEEENEAEFTTLDVVYRSEDQSVFTPFFKSMKKYLRENSPLRGWVVSCEQEDLGGMTFCFEEELCKKLRASDYKFDLELYNEDIKNLISLDIKNFIQKQEQFCANGFDGRRAYLLEGPPGTGKSDIIRSIISVLPNNYTTLVLNDKNIYELRKLKRLKFLFPALVVIEDIDLLVTSKQKWQVLLNFLDGFHAPERIITVMTSNNKDILLSSITNRPGRVDRIIHVGPGSETQRRAQLESLLRGLSLPEKVSIDNLTMASEGYTIAELRELIRRSIIYSAESVNITEEAITTVISEFVRQKKQNENEQLRTMPGEDDDEDDWRNGATRVMNKLRRRKN